MNFTLSGVDGIPIFVRCWETTHAPRAVVQIAHGLAEHSGRYESLAKALNAAGYAVYAHDHRGHGRTAATPDELGFFAETDGWRKCLDDLARVQQRIRDDHPGVPIVLFGHSMGSFLARAYASGRGETLAGMVLCATDGRPSLLARAGRLVARLERLRLGPRGRSRLIYALSFGSFNKAFAPNRTRFDWLSRDPAAVDAYAADPLCGFYATVQLWVDLLDAFDDLARSFRVSRIPKQLPIYVVTGTRDPVSANGRGVRQLLRDYREAGLQRVEQRFYRDARHELFHETNRDEVTRDLIAWLDKIVPVT
jgi:alpha-beta hydrolase superfamily lysophospholipase